MNDYDQVNQQEQGSQNGSAEISAEPVRNDERHQTTKECGGSNELAAVGKGKPVSLRKIEANRRNALKSTGPRTPTGKKIVAGNALKHGFFSKSLLVEHPEGRESRAEYDELRAAVHEYYKPVGFLEEFWADKIVVDSWRLRRLVRSESGHIALALAEHDYRRKDPKAANPEEPEAMASSRLALDALTDHLFLPTWADADKLLRYEAMINKQLNHAIFELERLQARPKGLPRILRNKANKPLSFNTPRLGFARTIVLW